MNTDDLSKTSFVFSHVVLSTIGIAVAYTITTLGCSSGFFGNLATVTILCNVMALRRLLLLELIFLLIPLVGGLFLRFVPIQWRTANVPITEQHDEWLRKVSFYFVLFSLIFIIGTFVFVRIFLRTYP